MIGKSIGAHNGKLVGFLVNKIFLSTICDKMGELVKT